MQKGQEEEELSMKVQMIIFGVSLTKILDKRN